MIGEGNSLPEIKKPSSYYNKMALCDPRRIRTFDLRIRSALLYPAELWNP